MDAETFLNVFTDNKPLNDIYVIQQYSSNMSKSNDTFYAILKRTDSKTQYKFFK